MPLFTSLLQIVRDFLRRCYDWTIHWADTSQGLTALFLIAVAESSFFPIPPDVLLIAIVASNSARWLQAAAICSAGSFIGAAIGYSIGYGLMATVGEPIIGFYGAAHHWDRFVSLADVWGSWFLAAAAFTPIPFKVATIASGAIEMPFASFLAISLLGRATRFFLVATTLRILGSTVRHVLEKHFDLVALLFFVLFVGGFLALRLF
jgi:membrane protein YqaA with SNARE-associated domain